MSLIQMETQEYDAKEWGRIIDRFDDVTLMQTWEYAAVKERLGGWEPIRNIFLNKGRLVGAAQGIRKKLPFMDRGMIWISGGPLWKKSGEANGIDQFNMILRKLRSYWVEDQNMYLRFAPPGGKYYSDKNMICELGFNLCQADRVWASAIIDLSNGEDDLRYNLHNNWKRNLKKAEMIGVSIEYGSTSALFGEFLEDYRRFLKYRKYYTTVSPEFISIYQNILPEERKMVVFTARKGTARLGSLLIARFNNYCIYLAGVVGDEGKKMYTSYSLFWNVIREMKKNGYKYFDLGGLNKTVTPQGILQFKQGLGGCLYSFIGEYESYNNNIINNIIKWAVHNYIKK